MALFIAASDETSGGNVLSVYHYAGWIAPELDWSQFFTPAWQERVLDGPPKIPYLNKTEIRSKSWRKQHGITEADADERLDEAARVIDTMGSLYPFEVSIDGSLFAPLYKPHKMKVGSGAQKPLQPDFIAFVAYVNVVLAQVRFKYPQAEKVDFLVENNSEITKHLYELYQTMPAALNHVGRPDLIPLVGEFIPGGKDRIPLQAADYLCWHTRRAEANMLDDERDLRRWGTTSHRKGLSMPLPADVLTNIAQAFMEREKENEAADRVRELRQHHAQTNKRPAQPDKSRARSGKGRKDI